MSEETLVFNDTMGNKVCASLSYVSPKNLIILLHGLSSHKNNTTNRSLVPVLNRSDISTLAVDFFGSGGSGGELEDLTISKAIANVEAAIAAARARGFKKLGLFGSSFGGAVALAVAAKHPVEISVLAMKAPVSDMKHLFDLRFGEKKIRLWRDTGMIDYVSGTSGEKYQLAYSFYQDAANHDLYKYAPGIESPTLIVHGTADDTVPFSQSEKLYKELRIQEKKLEEIRGADHRFTNQAHFQEMIDYSASWLLKIRKN